VVLLMRRMLDLAMALLYAQDGMAWLYWACARDVGSRAGCAELAIFLHEESKEMETYGAVG
jgi:hypothetical protein